MIFQERCCFMIGETALHEQTVPKVHLRHELEERWIEAAGLRIDGSTPTSARIRHEHVDPTPLLDNPRHHCFDRLMVTDIDSIPKAVRPDALISATVLSALMPWLRPRIPHTTEG